MRSVYLFYPSKITGGAEFLLKTVADLLKNKVKVTVIDIDGGWLSSNINGVDFLYINIESKILLNRNAVLITTANFVRELDLYFLGDFKIISWVVHPNNLTPYFPKLGSIQFKPIVRRLLKYTLLRSEYRKINLLSTYLEENDGIYTMDGGCNDVFFNYFGWRIKRYLPVVIPSEKIPTLPNYNKSCVDEVKCIWIGRLDGKFKNPILHHVLLDLSNYLNASNKKIIFNIIGEGPGLIDAKNIASGIDTLEINFLGEIRGDELIRVIKLHDVGFAMGTSSLEIAACGVATVLLDMTYGVVPKSYKYQWLYESQDYRIGRSIDDAIDKTLGNKKTIKDVFDNFFQNKKSVQTLCREHVIKYHSTQILENKILHAIENVNSNFQLMSDYSLMSKPYWYFLKKSWRKIIIFINNENQ